MMVGETGDDVINRLFYYLGEPPVYARDNLLPHRNPMSAHYSKSEEIEHVHVVQCSDIRFLNQTFAAANQGLVEFINSHPDKPISEPGFPEFSERFSQKCVEEDGTEVYWN